MIKGVQISAKRSGSTFFQWALDSHPEILSLGELFVNSPKHPPNPKKLKNFRYLPYKNYIRYYPEYSGIETYLNKIWDDNKDKSLVSFKLMYNQIKKSRNFEDIISDNNMYIIHLRRGNLIRHVISSRNSSKTDFFVIQELKPKKLMSMVKEYEKLQNYWTEILSKYPNYLEVFYEDVIGESKDGYTYISKEVQNRICSFFNIEDIPMYTNTKKKNKYHFLEYLPEPKNTIELFQNTKYEWMLEDEKFNKE